ncbi:conserved hypothetical protein [Ricinus communis]|uniref:Uncharacterized protein n=1 Tax=Ricinus communis TaxID=3988 RepID=B9SJ05_RICCO|nr:conserved hypothetical protein [Ricinus communis]
MRSQRAPGRRCCGPCGSIHGSRVLAWAREVPLLRTSREHPRLAGACPAGCRCCAPCEGLRGSRNFFLK